MIAWTLAADRSDYGIISYGIEDFHLSSSRPVFKILQISLQLSLIAPARASVRRALHILPNDDPPYWGGGCEEGYI